MAAYDTIVKWTPSGDENKRRKKQGEKQLISCKQKYDGCSLEIKVERSFWAPAVFLCARKQSRATKTDECLSVEKTTHARRAAHKSELVFIKATTGHQLL